MTYRENLQLHTIGLVLLHDNGTAILDQFGETIPTYDQKHIFESAKVSILLRFCIFILQAVAWNHLVSLITFFLLSSILSILLSVCRSLRHFIRQYGGATTKTSIMEAMETVILIHCKSLLPEEVPIIVIGSPRLYPQAGISETRFLFAMICHLNLFCERAQNTDY